MTEDEAHRQNLASSIPSITDPKSLYATSRLPILRINTFQPVLLKREISRSIRPSKWSMATGNKSHPGWDRSFCTGHWCASHAWNHAKDAGFAQPAPSAVSAHGRGWDHYVLGTRNDDRSAHRDNTLYLPCGTALSGRRGPGTAEAVRAEMHRRNQSMVPSLRAFFCGLTGRALTESSLGRPERGTRGDETTFSRGGVTFAWTPAGNYCRRCDR